MFHIYTREKTVKLFYCRLRRPPNNLLRIFGKDLCRRVITQPSSCRAVKPNMIKIRCSRFFQIIPEIRAVSVSEMCIGRRYKVISLGVQ